MNSPRIIFQQIELGPMMNFVYLIGCPETREGAVVDPAWDVPAILDLGRKSDLRITRILLTHGHPDHMNGLEGLLEATDAKVSLHSLETDYMKEVAVFFGMPVDFMDRRASSFQAVSDGDTIAIGKLQVKVLHTPGHTPGSQCFLIDGKLVSGDTLFVNACGRVDMPGGNPEAMWHSLTRKLAALDDDIILYPGHNYGTRSHATMREQKQSNPYLRFGSLDSFVRDMSEP